MLIESRNAELHVVSDFPETTEVGVGKKISLFQRDAPTFKARVGCNQCEDCRMQDCQICLVCLDKRYLLILKLY